MGQRRVVQWVDDLDGSLIEPGSTVTFALGVRRFEIDLGPANVDALHAALAPFVAGARRLPRQAQPVGRSSRE